MPAPDKSRLELEKVLKDLGELKEEFRPHLGILITGVVVRACCIPIGVVILYFAFGKINDVHQKEAFAAFTVFGLLLIFSGSVALVQSLRRFSDRLLICSEGLSEISYGKVRMWRWQEIEKVEETLNDLRAGLRRNRYTIRFRSGERLRLDLQTVVGVERFVEMIRGEAQTRGITWQTTELLAG